jgi:hypothetical protein
VSEEYLYGDYRILRADRQPCPICGHPTGDCGTENKHSYDDLFGIGLFKSTDSEHKVMVDEDVLEERIMYGNVTIKVIKFRKGQMITIEEARAHGLLKE